VHPRFTDFTFGTILDLTQILVGIFQYHGASAGSVSRTAFRPVHESKDFKNHFGTQHGTPISAKSVAQD